MREWLVIESSMKNAVFAPPELRDRKGYIPRDTAERLLGRSLDGTIFFTRDESEKMRACSEWRDTAPGMSEEEADDYEAGGLIGACMPASLSSA